MTIYSREVVDEVINAVEKKPCGFCKAFDRYGENYNVDYVVFHMSVYFKEGTCLESKHDPKDYAYCPVCGRKLK